MHHHLGNHSLDHPVTQIHYKKYKDKHKKTTKTVSRDKKLIQFNLSPNYLFVSSISSASLKTSSLKIRKKNHLFCLVNSSNSQIKIKIKRRNDKIKPNLSYASLKFSTQYFTKNVERVDLSSWGKSVDFINRCYEDVSNSILSSQVRQWNKDIF